MAEVIREVDFNNHHYTFENTFYNTGSMSHDILTMTDENGNEYKGEVTWINRPYHRFDLEEAFTEIVSKAFGPKAKELILEINKSAYSVEGAIDKFFSQFKPEDIFDNPAEAEQDTSEEARRQALATYLEVDASDIESSGDNEFEVDGETYKVLTDSEADDEFEQSVRNLWDEGGLSYLDGYMKDSILEHCIDEDELEGVVRDDIENYVNDMDEDDVISECVDEDIISEEEAYDEEGDYREDLDIDSLKDKLIEHRMNNVDDYVDYLKNLGFDDEYFANYIDDDKAVEALKDNIIANSSRGQEIAYYDGDEIELDNGFFAYRTN